MKIEKIIAELINVEAMAIATQEAAYNTRVKLEKHVYAKTPLSEKKKTDESFLNKYRISLAKKTAKTNIKN